MGSGIVVAKDRHGNRWPRLQNVEDRGQEGDSSIPICKVFIKRHTRETYQMNMTHDLSPDELLTTTRAVRRRMDFDRPIADEVIRECLAVAQQAPTATNQQN